MACLAVYLHPEDTEKSPVDLSGLTAESLFGSPFSETPEEMIAYRNYVCAHEIDIVNLGKPLNRYGDGPVERNVDFGRSGRQFGESECSHEDVSNQDDALDPVDLFGSGTSHSGASDELHAGLEAKALKGAREKAAEMAGLEYQGSDEIKEALAKPGLPDFSEKPSDVKKDGVER